MTPRWKIRRERLGDRYVWAVLCNGVWDMDFRVWENALTYIELHEVNR